LKFHPQKSNSISENKDSMASFSFPKTIVPTICFAILLLMGGSQMVSAIVFTECPSDPLSICDFYFDGFKSAVPALT
jgi:hypothetical protein